VHYQPQHHLLKDRIILVTGASDGIGREAALTYSRYSASVILVGRNEEKLRSVAQEIDQAGGLPALVHLDLLTCTPQSASSWRSRLASTTRVLTAYCTTPVCWAMSARWINKSRKSGSR
jgi:short-subunit dehydrogenase